MQQKWETKEAHTTRLAIEEELRHLEKYAQGKIKEPSSGPLTHQQKALRAAQNAHFHLTIAAEINKKALAPETRKEVESLMASADKTLNEAFQDGTIIKSSTQALFEAIAAKTNIVRRVIEGKTHFETRVSNKTILTPLTYNFVLFGINPDGKCGDYAINLWDRKETISLLTKDSAFLNKIVEKCPESLEEGYLREVYSPVFNQVSIKPFYIQYYEVLEKKKNLKKNNREI